MVITQPCKQVGERRLCGVDADFDIILFLILQRYLLGRLLFGPVGD